MHRKYIYNILIATMILFSFSHCGKEDISKDAARLRIKLTDAAAPSFKEMFIDINKIEVFHVDSVGGNGEWVELSYVGGEYNLLTLMNGKMVQLTDEYFQSGGKIDKIRITLGDNNRIKTITDKTFTLHKASRVVDYLVIDDVNAVLSPHVIVSIVIDINAALSIYELNGNYYLDPRARAFPETFGGSLKGNVVPAEASPIILITREGDSLLSLPEGEQGMFLFTGLEEGVWKVHLIAHPESPYQDTIFMSDTILRGKVTEIKPNPIRLSFSGGLE